MREAVIRTFALFLIFSMRSIFRVFLNRKVPKSIFLSTNILKASTTGGMATAAIYACSITNPTALGAVPEDSKGKEHHLKGGSGFRNPWPSYTDFNPLKVGMSMAW
jgi:N-acyl-phosphatidylethanolamine-hydrolysing phospholipase D